ncbi:MAG: Rrf2 family transcriptional regulator [Chloroherpetonaceae bacterium]|nr:Rrf2 family transcriptional regulator [Chthonomonadaceae bacterium]MDW8208607.1 Rrf2 family transcriptional regulator [Chloroherpetonaceae bacterium]
MLSLSKQADYALLALAYLARVEEGRLVNAREIALKFDLPAELLAKILQRLARADLLVSTPGPTGGYRLARSARSISVGAIVVAVDGPPALVPCLRSDHNDCEQSRHCTIQRPLARLNQRIFQMLERVSLAEISADDPEENRIALSEACEYRPLAPTT